MLCNTAEEEKIAAKRHFFAKGAQNRRSSAYWQNRGAECTMQIPQQVWRSNDETVYGRRQSAPSAQKDHRSGAGHRPHGGRGRPLRGYSCADQRGQIRAEPGGAGGASSTACATASSTATRTKRSRTLRRRSSAFRTWAEQVFPLSRPFSAELHERREAVLCCFSLFARFITYTSICIISQYPLWYRKESLP